MAARRVVVETCPPRTPAVATEQIGGDTALIEKHILRRIVDGQPVPPLAALCSDVRPTLFVGVYGFF